MKSVKPLRWAALFCLSGMLLAACGGGGGGGGGSDTTAPTVTITSHSDGADVTGSRTVTVSGTLADDGTIVSLTVTQNGTDVTASLTITSDQTSFGFDLTLTDNVNALDVGATDGAGNTGNASVNLSYPYIALTTQQDASLVIGQPDFTSGSPNQGGGVAANTLSQPNGNALVVGGRLFLPDSNNHRVLGFNTIPTANDASADFALGQPDLTSNTPGLSATAMNGTRALSSDGSKLFVVDANNQRVLIYNTIPTTSGAAADVVVGQADMTSKITSCSASGFFVPLGAIAVGGRLIVASFEQHRVLIWNTVPTSNGVAADLVLGQADFTSCSPNGGGGSVVAANAFERPSIVWSDGTRLAVAEANNNRVLIWNTFPTTNGQAADLVLGQADFTTGTAGATSATTFIGPYVFSNGNQFFVSDQNNHRVLIWNSFPTANGQVGGLVLGQADFTSSTFGTTINQFLIPFGVYAANNRLFVADSSNNRILIFQGP